MALIVIEVDDRGMVGFVDRSSSTASNSLNACLTKAAARRTP
jgi:hypothetical protein